MTGAEHRPATTLGMAPSVPETTITTSAALICATPGTAHVGCDVPGSWAGQSPGVSGCRGCRSSYWLHATERTESMFCSTRWRPSTERSLMRKQ